MWCLLPAQIGDIAYQNKAALSAILFKAAPETLITITVDPKHLGAKIALTAVLHTWGSALTRPWRLALKPAQGKATGLFVLRYGSMTARPSRRGHLKLSLVALHNAITPAGDVHFQVINPDTKHCVTSVVTDATRGE